MNHQRSKGRRLSRTAKIVGALTTCLLLLTALPATVAGASGTATVSGQVWFDSNGDGIQQSTETSGVPDVTVELVNSSASVVATKTTDVNGDFLFSAEQAGTYTLQFVTLSGYQLSPAQQGGNPATYSWPNPTTGVTPAFTLAASGSGASAVINAGIDQRPASTSSAYTGTVQAGGTAYMAFPVNAATGEMDAELTWTGTASLSLLVTNPSGTTIASSTNQTSGSTSVVATASVAGTYKVAVKAVSGGTPFSLTINYPPGVAPPPPAAAISGQVWFDSNADGIQQSSETTGVPDVTVEVLNSSQEVVATATSNVSGDYSFATEPAGTYTLQFTTLSGYRFSPALQGGNPATYSWPNPSTGITPAFTLSGSGSSQVVNAGIDEEPASTNGTFSGTVQVGGTSYVSFPINVQSTGEMDAELTWSGSATMSLLLTSPTGATIASDTNQTSGTASVVGTATVTGTYKFAVKAIANGSSFSLNVDYPQAPPTPPPPASYVATTGYSGPAGVYPYGMAYDPVDGSIVVGDVWNYRVLRYTAAGNYVGIVSHNAPKGQLGGIGSNFGIAVDSQGDTFVADQSNARIVEFNQQDQWVQTIGVGGGPNAGENDGQGCGNGLLQRPTDIAIDASGNLYVTDTLCRSVHVYSPTGQWLRDITFNLSSIGVYTAVPRGIAVGPDGNLYIAEFNSKRILVYSTTGTQLGMFPQPTDLQDPRGVAIDPGHDLLYLTDAGTDGGKVYQYALPAPGTYSGTLITELKTSASHPFNSVRFVTVDPAGNVYLSDTWGHVVWKFDYQLNQLPWATAPEPPPNGGFNKLNGIGINPATGVVYAMDTFENRVQAFATTVGSNGQPEVGGTPESCASPTSCPTYLLQFGSRQFPEGDKAGFNYPRALTFGGGDVWTDGGRSIEEFDPNGNFIRRWGGQGTAPGEFADNIFGVFVVPNPTTGDGLIYVTDSGNCRLQVFNYEGVLQEYMGSCGSGANQMNHPNQVVVQGNLAYVADGGNNQVVVWNLTTEQIVQTIRGPFGTQNLDDPTGLALSPDGTQLYIADYYHYRVVRYALNGSSSVVMTTGADTPTGKFLGPNYLVFGPDGRLYVSDDSEHILSFNINS
jgi:tripartite motif-containing protein 71